MKLSRLLDGCDIITASGAQTMPDADIEITVLTTDSRSARRGSLFVCISGARSDGHDFAASAYESGCRCFLAERPLDLAKDASVTVVSSTRRALAVIAQRFYGEPAASLRLIGITGTKGKSTTAELIRSGLEAAGRRTGRSPAPAESDTAEACVRLQIRRRMRLSLHVHLPTCATRE